jgi:hypothetical protein
MLAGNPFVERTVKLAEHPSSVVLGKSLNYGILPDPNPNPAFNRIRVNTDPDPDTLGFVTK